MSHDSTVLLQQVLSLPENERAEMAARLIDSLDTTVEDDVEAAWSVEIEKRLAELRTGKVVAIPWPEARRMILEEVDDANSA